METSYYEDDHEQAVNVDLEEHHRHFRAERHGRHIVLKVHGRSGEHPCAITSEIDVCFTCEEYERFLCELRRVRCGHRECCEDREIRVFDQDDDDECEDDKPVRRTPSGRKGR